MLQVGHPAHLLNIMIKILRMKDGLHKLCWLICKSVTISVYFSVFLFVSAHGGASILDCGPKALVTCSANCPIQFPCFWPIKLHCLPC